MSLLDPDAIFRSLPKSVIIDNQSELTAHIEYADRGKTVNEILKTSPIAVTIRYYADRSDNEATPGNRQLGRTLVADDIQYKIGKMRQVTLTVNVHVKDAEDVPADKVIKAYVDLLKIWVLKDLPAIVTVVDDTGISDLTYLENGLERRQIDVIIRYESSYTKRVKTIVTVDAPDITLA